jgi:hypothetical protein
VTAANGRSPLPVFITVDVELWPSSWEGYRDEFQDCFRRYIKGDTGRGEFGLPLHLRMARDHGLRFTFLVESLFACEFGIGPLADIVGQIDEAGQDTELHAHPEWVRHASTPIFRTGGRYTFAQFTREEQSSLVAAALANLRAAGARNVSAFRAGSFAANADTLAAVARAGLSVDSSFKLGSSMGFAPIVEHVVRDEEARLIEYPLSIYEDLPGSSRHLQLSACSFDEITFVLESAREKGWAAVVLLSHSAELLDESRTRADRIVVRRLERLCAWLADRRERFVTCGLADRIAEPPPSCRDWSPIRSTWWRTLRRMGEQTRRTLGTMISIGCLLFGLLQLFGLPLQAIS